MRVSSLLWTTGLAAVFFSSSRSEGAEEKPLWLACGPAEFIDAIEPLAAFRRTEGLETLLVPLPPAEAIAQAPRRPDYVLIVGDDTWPRGKDEAELRPWQVRTKRLPFYKWIAAQQPEFASDLAWGGIGEDGVPLIPVGRLPVRSAEEGARVAKKIIAWEKRPPLLEDLSLPMWAGDPNYGAQFTTIFMSFLFAQAKRFAPPWLELWNVCGDPRNPLSGWPPAQARIFNERTARGGLFAALMGHGTANLFRSVNLRGKDIGYRLSDAHALTSGPPRPPEVLFSCDSGRFTDENERGLAEELFLAPAGPALCVGATNHSHPLANFYTATSLLHALAEGPDRFGPLWLRAQHDAIGRSEGFIDIMLQDVEGHLGDRLDLAQVKRDQALVYAIFGDPATRVRLPRPLKTSIERTDAGWSWKAETVPEAAQLTVSLRAATPNFPRQVPAKDEAGAQALFEKANAALAFRTMAVLNGGEMWEGIVRESGTLRLVALTPGALYVAALELK